MTNILMIPPDLAARPGVRMTPPPPEWREQVDGMVTRAVQQIRDGKSGVFLAWIDTEAGVNAALTKRVVSGGRVDVDVVAYFGSKWGKPVRAGAAVRVEF